MKYLNSQFPQNIIRSKGLFWLASRSDKAILWSTAGSSVKLDNAGDWWAAMPYSERITHQSYFENKEALEKDWDSVFGDRKTELVFIGQHLESEGMIKKLNTCLLTESEIELWSQELFTSTDRWPL